MTYTIARADSKVSISDEKGRIALEAYGDIMIARLYRIKQEPTEREAIDIVERAVQAVKDEKKKYCISAGVNNSKLIRDIFMAVEGTRLFNTKGDELDPKEEFGEEELRSSLECEDGKSDYYIVSFPGTEEAGCPFYYCTTDRKGVVSSMGEAGPRVSADEEVRKVYKPLIPLDVEYERITIHDNGSISFRKKRKDR